MLPGGSFAIRAAAKACRRQLSGLVFAAGCDRNFQWDALSDKNTVGSLSTATSFVIRARDLFMYRMFTLKVKNARFIAPGPAKEIHCSLNLIMIMSARSLLLSLRVHRYTSVAFFRTSIVVGEIPTDLFYRPLATVM